MSKITKGERTELKSVVRQQFKVLRSELEQREAELDAEVEAQIAEKYHDEDTEWNATLHRLQEVVSAANREFNDVLYEAGFQQKGSTEQVWVTAHSPQKQERPRNELRSLAKSQLRAKLKAARLRLDREEADLLRTLAVGALETEEAHAFLSGIPTVGELVPASRLAELEAGLVGPEGVA